MSVTDSILQAISITAKSEISKVKSDVTRQYVISDIIDADKGIYKASTTTGNTNLQIEVYRRAGDAKLYQVGDSVDVHIPEGDYTRTKTIISTYATSGGGAATTSSSSGGETEQKAANVLSSWITLNSVNLEETADSPAVVLDLSYKKLDFSALSDGATIISVDYALGANNINVPAEGWQTIIPTLTEEKSYIWVRTTWDSNGAILYTYFQFKNQESINSDDLWGNYYCLAPNGVYLRLGSSTTWSDLEASTWEELSSKFGFELGAPSAYSSSLIYYQRLEDASGTREVSSQEITPEKPIYTCNYNSARLRGAYQIQLGDKSTKISTWPYWEMYLYVYDGLAGRHFKYPFIIGQDYLSSYMTTAKSIPEDIIINFDENNLRIDKYWFKIEIPEESELKDGADNNLSSVIIKWNNPVAEFGWKSSEYADAVYIYEVDNKKFFDGETMLQLGAKINYNKKEYTISEAIAALTEAEKVNYYFCWATDNNTFVSYQQDDTLYEVKPNAVTSLVSYTGGLYSLELSETETVLTDSMWQNAQSTARISSALTFDYSKNLWYNYSMKIISTNGLVVTARLNQANTTTQLVAQIYRGDTLLSGPVKEPETSAEYNDATIYYTELEEAGTIIKSYWIFEAPGAKRNVSIQWYKNTNLVAVDSENAFRTTAIKSDETGIYKCDITIGDKGVIYGS